MPSNNKETIYFNEMDVIVSFIVKVNKCSVFQFSWIIEIIFNVRSRSSAFKINRIDLIFKFESILLFKVSFKCTFNTINS